MSEPQQSGSWSLDRRTFLTASATAFALAACGGGGGPQANGLGVQFPDGFRAPSIFVAGHGPQRFPFFVVADDGFPMTTNAPAEIVMEVLFEGAVIETQTVTGRGIGQFTPHYPLVFTPEQVGVYSARTEFSEFDVDFAVIDRADTSLFQVGDPLPAFQTPTFDDLAGVATLCTRADGPCPFHEITLEEAINDDNPTLMLIATPEFCQTNVCGPNVEWLIELAESRDDLNVIHHEVYEDFAGDTNGGGLPTRAPMLEEWDIAFEPSLFALDASGTITNALHLAFDRDEMEELISAI